MQSRTILAALPIFLWASHAVPQDGSAATACDTLIAARRVDAAAGSAQAAQPEAGCRRIPREAIGPVEQRAMIGGAPYESLRVTGAGRCLWIVP